MEFVIEHIKAYSEGLLRPPCCSLTDFYCQNIQGQFSRRLLHCRFSCKNCPKVSFVVSTLGSESCFCLKIVFLLDMTSQSTRILILRHENDDYLDQELFVDDSLRIE